MPYNMTIKGGAVYRLADDGQVLWDGDRNMGPFSGEWRIIGFSIRHHSHRLISLADAAKGADLGQGWIHDIDHGTRRIWGIPKHHRVVKVERINNASSN